MRSASCGWLYKQESILLYQNWHLCTMIEDFRENASRRNKQAMARPQCRRSWEITCMYSTSHTNWRVKGRLFLLKASYLVQMPWCGFHCADVFVLILSSHCTDSIVRIPLCRFHIRIPSYKFHYTGFIMRIPLCGFYPMYGFPHVWPSHRDHHIVNITDENWTWNKMPT